MKPQRKNLPHEVPSWVPAGADYFITICTQPRGGNQLCNEATAALLLESMQFYQARGDWWIHLCLLMPDHLHALISFSPQVRMRKTVTNWKTYVARQGDIDWQRDFFDHRLRAHESYREKAHYIRMNPVRAALCESPDDWPYIWEARR